MKRCFKCKTDKPRSEFYPHPRMADGLLGKCKTCAKADYKVHRANNRVRLAEYEHQRQQNPERRKRKLEYSAQHRIRHPDKATARHALQNAIATGKMTRKPCEMCGNPKSEGHHHDYAKPLDVRWLCRKHHLEAHGKVPVLSV